ncbi:hypothetical protein [Brevibacterium sp.]|uniref:hypothetical protein n=1 Tax=Brevibacterium sp. TaxID=1701 RepID=UPI00281118AE|nr:hypothetical protein [Brevibacterium sp.]
MNPLTAVPSHPSTDRGARTLLRRWPAALGVALGLSQLLTDDPRSVTGALLVLLLATTGYVLIAALDRPRWSWAVIGSLVVLLTGTRLASAPPVVELGAVVLLILAAVTVGVARGTWKKGGLHRWQPLAALGFLALCLAALAVSTETGRLIIGVGLIAHTVWDCLHWRRHAVVSASLAEWCAALDLTLGVGVLVVTIGSW